MSRPLNRLLLASTSALGITALTLGLVAPAGAAPADTVPTTPLDDRQALAETIEELRASPLLAMIPGRTAEQLVPGLGAGPQSRGARMAATTASSFTPVFEEVGRTSTSATFRFTLPQGELTRDNAVLQAFTEVWGYRASVLSWLTDPAVDMGADHTQTYADQLIGLRVADLVRENFSVSGATPTTAGMQDHFTVPAGQNSFDITFTSSRTKGELASAISEIVPFEADENDQLNWIVEYLFQTRMSLPETSNEVHWTYGDRLLVMKSVSSSSYPNGANELSIAASGNRFESTASVTRVDGQRFSGDRVISVYDGQTHLEGVPLFGDLAKLLSRAYPPPLQPGDLTPQVEGASPVRDGFYLPNPGVETITVRVSGTGPKTETEARSRFETWVTDTCQAEMTDLITNIPEGTDPVTWQEMLDEMVEAIYSDESATDNATAIYTGPTYIDEVLAERENQFAAVLEMLGGLSAEDMQAAIDVVIAALPDWDAMCGATDGPGDGEGPGDGDDGPGDVQTPTSISVDVPSTGVAGEPISLSATVLDDAGSPVEGQQVTFTIDEQQAVPGTLRAATLNLDPAADGPTTLTATTDINGVATVTYTPSASGTLHVSASTGGTNPVSTEDISLVTVTPAPGGGDEDDDGDTAGGGNQSGSGSLGSLGSLFGSLSS